MSWLGIGLTSWGFRNVADINTPPLPELEPSALWTGTAASGFTTTPTDPTRTTAKPALRLITPPFQWFTDTLDVGVMAAANDDGSLFNTLGIADVTFYFEGNVVTVDAPSFNTIPTQRGPRTYFGWWVKLKKPAGTAGNGHLYVEATARDATMQKRVMGPYTYSPQTTLYDAELTVTPSLAQITGSRYQTITAAIGWAKANNKVNPLITITEPGIYEPGTNFIEYYTPAGYMNITASVPGVTIGRTAAQWVLNGNNSMNNDRSKLHLFGENITLDFRYVSTLEMGSSTFAAIAELSHWLDGITMTNSDPAEEPHWAGAPRDDLAKIIIGHPWFTEVALSNLAIPMTQAALVRGCEGTNLFGDVANEARCILQSTFDGNDNEFWNDDRPAFSVQYTGAETVATIARSGGARGTGGGGGIWTVTIGATSSTFSTGRANLYNGDGRLFADLVAWLNTLPDVTATLLIAPFDRVASSGSLPGRAGQGFTATSIKASPLTVVSNFDIHSDWYQHVGGNIGNIIVAFNTVINAQSQLFFLSPGVGPRGQDDILFFGNIFHAGDAPHFDSTVASSQWGRPNAPVTARHVVIAHNTFVNQKFLLRNEGGGLAADVYCLMRNNTMPSFGIAGTAPVPNLTIDGAHLQTGATAPAGSVNVTIGGTPATMFLDAAIHNYAPAGELAANVKTSAVPVDLKKAKRGATAPAGALV
ncbi:MAG: hypothetical protein CVT75_08195 [Alphaproteobacteria bacterium HGW-Alphaproteobacteria-14]|nr:MAG: hypothetical protein CVT75_08195 [Alphaproteobacteria bacterium HGW-Alphaproteobacteria-14]